MPEPIPVYADPAGWQESRMGEWIAEHPWTALAARTPAEPAYAEQLHRIASALALKGLRDRASWVWGLYRSACR